MVLDELARKIPWLEDLEAIKTLNISTPRLRRPLQPDGIAQLFVEDAISDGGGFGRRSAGAIRRFFRRAPKVLSLAARR